MFDINGCILNSRNTDYWVWRSWVFHNAWNCARAAFLMIFYYEDTIVPDGNYFDF